ncbi:Ankyrin repeat-containing domain [Trinorchestia longiramus]|nr:Ankyrin repeat-containing domain [Trinorchestia longiramus]
MGTRFQKAVFTAIGSQHIGKLRSVVGAREKAALPTHWPAVVDSKTLDTALHAAVKIKHKLILGYLLERCGACLEQCNSRNRRPLHEAVEQCNMRAVEELLKAGVTVDARAEQHWTPLMAAAGMGQRDALHIVCKLLWYGSNPAAVNAEGWNACHVCCCSGSKKILEILIKADPSQILALTGAGETALHIAARNGRSDLFPVLFRHGFVSSNKVCASRGFNALLAAVAAGQVTAAEVLLAIWPDTEVRQLDHRGRNALQLAVEGGHMAAVRYASGVLELDPGHRDHGGQTCVHRAAACGQWQLLPLLVWELGGDVHAVDAHGLTALDVAHSYQQSECAEVLQDLEGVRKKSDTESSSP